MTITHHRFKVSSAVKSLLGKDLVTNKYVAVLELVKNSYDAGSNDVWVVFDHLDEKGTVSAIRIVDNGSGMSETDILDKWLIVGYSEKTEGKSNEFGVSGNKRGVSRTMAGQKGIGRLSCDTLGSRLKMTTMRENEDMMHIFSVDWADFEKDQKTEFQEIEVELKDLPKTSFKLPDGRDSAKGTVLEITNPRDTWTHKDLERLAQYLQRMVNPYSSDSSDTFNVFLLAGIFRAEDDKLQIGIKNFEEDNPEGYYKGIRPVNGLIKNTVVEEIKELTTRVSCSVSKEVMTTELYDKERLIYSMKEKNVYKYLDNCRVDIFFLNTNAKTVFTRRMGVRPVNFGSIYVYKNYFRVLPYGDEGNDWLDLDRRKQQGYARFLSTREIIGRVSIKDNSGIFREASSREGGFIKNNAFDELKDFVKKYAIARLTNFVVDAIRWDRTNAPSPEERRLQSLQIVAKLAGGSGNTPPLDLKIGPELLSIIEEKMIRDIPDIVEEIERIGSELPEEDRGKAIVDRARVLKSAVDRLQIDLDTAKKETLFKVKAKSSEEFSKSILHEVKQSAPSIVKALTRVTYALDGMNVPKNVMDDLRYSLLRTQRIEQISKVGSLANFNTMGNKITESVPKFVKDYVNWAADKVTDMKIEPCFTGDTLVATKKFTPLELTIILDNLWTNAYKAGATKILFSFQVQDDKVIVQISDNGSGVTDDACKSLFTEGFSTRGGSGIGLHSSRYIAENNGWTLDFVGNNVSGLESGACFKLVM